MTRLFFAHDRCRMSVEDMQVWIVHHNQSAGAHLIAMKRGSLGGGAGHKRQKHGRRELRDVKRTLRRSRKFGDSKLNESPENGERVEANDSIDNKDSVVAEEVEQSGMAYNALLTLLDSEKDSKSKKLIKSSEQDDDLSDDFDAKLVASEDEEEEDELSDDDADANNKHNAFDVHFNKTTEDEMNKYDETVSSKWPVQSKKNIGEYVVTTSNPPNREITEGGLSNIKKKVMDAFHGKHFSLSGLDSSLLTAMLNYQSVLFPYRHYLNTSYRQLYSMHAINHVLKTRDHVLKNTERIKHAQELAQQGKSQAEKEYRDQGFTRPKVLILLPTRNAAYEVVENILLYSGSEQQENKKKFKAQFYNTDESPESKPDDFRDSFKGNNNDFFCLGMKFTRKSTKLYSSFYSSDIIIASPLGLSMILENPDKKKRQYDFLSSIEVFIVDRANQIEAQNWAHVNMVLKYLNKIPKDFHDADFSRIRMWYINDQARLLRQTLVFCEYSTPPITSLITKSTNLGGKVRYKPIITSKNCTMNSIGLRLKQIFHRFDSPSPMDDSENRYKYFINTMLPSLLNSTSYNDGILIYIPSYFDYVRIKNYMKNSSKVTFEGVDEYSSQSKLTRYRQQFVSGKCKILLYTERLHYFRRFEINGVKTLLMYGVPSNPEFYKELVRFIGKSVFKEVVDVDLSFVKVMYSQWNATALERIVGGDRAPVLCSGSNEMYEFR